MSNTFQILFHFTSPFEIQFSKKSIEIFAGNLLTCQRHQQNSNIVYPSHVLHKWRLAVLVAQLLDT